MPDFESLLISKTNTNLYNKNNFEYHDSRLFLFSNNLYYNNFMSKKDIAIITGAAGGLGREFVRLLDNDQNLDGIFVLGRNEEKLNSLVTEFGNKIKPYIIDLSDRNKIKEFEQYLKNQNVNIKTLINNAGYAKFCSYDDISFDESLDMMDVNVNAVVGLCIICIPFMQKGSHIINIASQAGFQPLPYMNIYASTKAFVKNYSQALNVELKAKGITVTAVCPGWIKTPFFSRAEINSPVAPRHFWFRVTPDIIAKKALEDAYKGKDISIYGLYVNICHIFTKILPEKFIIKFWLWQQKIK